MSIMYHPSASLLIVLLSTSGFCLGGSYNSDTPDDIDYAQKFRECPRGDGVCERDRIGFEAIRHLHHQIDDDRDGSLDRSESDEFIRDELKYEDGFDRHSKFHGDDDLISIDDLWKQWIQSEVYNWTVDDVAEWLTDHVELPQYLDLIKVNAVDGHTLPRIAGNVQYVVSILGIKNLVHRQKLSLKAMDLVLFGAPKRHNYVKDILLVGALLIACGGCWLAYIQHRYSQNHLHKVMKDLDTLRKAEQAFSDLQQELEEAQQHKEQVEIQKRTLENQMQGQINIAKTEADRLRFVRESTEEEISRLRLAEEELLQVRSVLKKTERELDKARSGLPLVDLQAWLQLTYEIETTHYDKKRETAERQLMVAKEMCEKIRKKRNAFLGSLRVAHSTSIDDTDHMIMSARAALEEMKMDLQERSQRWQNIESICGLPVMQNPGQICIEAMLRSAGHAYTGGSSSLMSNRALSGSMVAPLNVEDADEDQPPGVLTSAVAFFGQNLGNEVKPYGMVQDPGFPSAYPTPYQRSHSTLSSVSGHGSSVSSSSSGASRPTRLTTITSHDTDSERDTDSEHSTTSSNQMTGVTNIPSPTSTVSAGDSPPVNFHIGSPSPEAVADENRLRTNSFGQYNSSVTGVGALRPISRTLTLPTSLSEKAANKGTLPITKSHALLSPNNDENSSPESVDGSVGSDRDKKKKKKNVLTKLLKKKTS